MKKFKIEFSRTFKEFGEVEIEADDDSHARELAQELLSDDSDNIEWSNGEIDTEYVESVSEL